MTPTPARGNNLDTVRRHNLSTVLEFAHRHGSISRAELTRETGLNRSTIGALVSELVDLGLVGESGPDANNRVGRPSPIVAPDDGVVAIAVNPEIDAVTLAIVGLSGVVHRRLRRPTTGVPTAAEVIAIIVNALEELRPELDGRSVVGIGVAVPGVVHEADGVVRLAPHLGWQDEAFAAPLAEATGLPVHVANDANLGAGAEWLFGAGRGVSDLVYVNGGASGVGSGVIAGGRALAGFAGYAGELGHTLVNSAGVRCHCGAIGCLETEVGRSPFLELLGLDNVDADEFERTLLASDDPRVIAEVARQQGFLAVALRNAVNIFNPELVVLGGFLGSLLAVAPSVLQKEVSRQALQPAGESVAIVRAALGSDILLVGAAEIAFAPVLADPASFRAS